MGKKTQENVGNSGYEIDPSLLRVEDIHLLRMVLFITKREKIWIRESILNETENIKPSYKGISQILSGRILKLKY